MSDLGYVRIGTDFQQSEQAVQWWYFWSYDDGWAFARGGNCRTLREARHKLSECHGIRERERARFLGRYDYQLMEDGSLREIDRGPYDIKRLQELGLR